MTKVKICGLSTKEAVETAVSAGADYIGFVFAPSKRQVTLEEAAELAKLIPADVKKVGVFVSPSRVELLEAIDKVGLDLVQVHGQVADDLFENLPCASIQAVQVDGNGHVPNSQADYLLFDAPVAGSGQSFDWGQLDTTGLAQPFFIAGGLNEDNVVKAIQHFTPYYAKNLTQHIGGAKIYLKREDLNHTGAHKINNALGQVWLAKRMGKKKIIAETGAGQHGVATATAAALFNMECTIYMGEEDVKRQALNVFRMELLGAKVEAVTDGSRVLKDAVNAALRSWVANIDDTHYILGSALGPHPFPEIVRDFQSVIGREAKQQYRDMTGQNLPDALVACVGGGSNAIGLFHPFVEDESVAMYGAEAAGLGVDTEHHAATLTKGRPGVLHGSLMDVLQDAHGQILEAFSISAGLDYPGIGPEHSHYHDIKRASYVPVTDEEALEGFQLLSRVEGIIPALESSHAIAFAVKLAKELGPEKSMIVCLSGRGDKDVVQVKDRLEADAAKKGEAHA